MDASDLHVAITRRKLPCVVDPLLALGSPRSAALTLRLAVAFEAWLPRSFWQVLDASEWIAADPCATDSPLPDARALADWLALRECTDAGAWTLRWVGDNVAESHLRDAEAPELIDRFERLHEALLERLPEDAAAAAPWPRGGVLDGNADVAALSAALDGALVICTAKPNASCEPPPLVQLLRRAGLAPHGPALDDGTALLAAEQRLVREALAGAGAVPLLQRLPSLAAVHVLAGDGAAPWQDAQAWWYWI